MQGDMSPEVKDIGKPESCYAERYDHSTLNYIERQDKIQSKQAGKIKSQKFSGRYQ